MDINMIKEKLEDPCNSGFIEEVSSKYVEKIKTRIIRIIDVVKALDPILTNGSHEIRLRGVETLTQIIVSLDNDSLIEKEIQVLNEFLCLRLIDHKSMEKPALRCLSYFIQCKNKPQNFNKDLLYFLKKKASVKSMNSQNRKLIYEIVKMIVIERYQLSGIMDCEFVYNLVELFDGESDAENLMICFSTVSFILKNFKDLEPYVDDIFEWISSYYPIDYTPNETDEINIQKSELIDALYDCFYATELNSDNLQTLLLEKLDSILISTKLESLKCLERCYKTFSTKTIKNYATSLWAAVRMECLKKMYLLDPLLSDACYSALSALAYNLSSDEEFYYRFICDRYEELSIPFRKPELDLYEPAARLMAHIAQPKHKGFDYILSKMLPVALNAINDGEFRPTSGLTYIFDQLFHHHRGTKLSLDLNEPINKISEQIIPTILTNGENLKFINALICYQVEFDINILNNIIEKLLNGIDESVLDLEGCLAKISINYRKVDILFGSEQDCDIKNLIKSVTTIRDHNYSNQKLSIYLRIVSTLLHSAKCSELNNYYQELDNFLEMLREIALAEPIKNKRIISHIGTIHSIIINKLSDENNQSILMKFFTSEYCQNLVPKNVIGEKSTHCETYLIVIEAVLKSLVIRNSKFSVPLINLLLNFITSEKIDEALAINASKSFISIYEDDVIFNISKDNNYQVFALYKQKFYSQTNKEIKLRYNSQESSLKKYILLSAIGMQIPHLPSSIYRNDYEWLLRELIQLLLKLKSLKVETDECLMKEHLVFVMYQCLNCLVKHDTSGNLVGLLDSLVNLNLEFAMKAKTLKVRRQAIYCLASMVTLCKKTELLVLKPMVVDRLGFCLKDKKRLVRLAAADARLKWILIGQPNGI